VQALRVTETIGITSDTLSFCPCLRAGTTLPVQKPTTDAQGPRATTAAVPAVPNNAWAAAPGAAVDGAQVASQSSSAGPSRTAAALQRLSMRRSSAGGAGLPAAATSYDQGPRRVSGGSHNGAGVSGRAEAGLTASAGVCMCLHYTTGAPELPGPPALVLLSSKLSLHICTGFFQKGPVYHLYEVLLLYFLYLQSRYQGTSLRQYLPQGACGRMMRHGGTRMRLQG
jgi:hypothetical protein